MARPYYDKANAALEAAYIACFSHPSRGAVAMSHGPFSGVNEALGIVALLEARCAEQDDEIQRLRRRLGDE